MRHFGILFVALAACLGNSFASNVFTPISQIKISVPRSLDAIAILRNTPLTQITLKSRAGSLDSVLYEFEENHKTLRTGSNGEVFVGNGFLQLEDTTNVLLSIKSNVTKEVLARVVISITPLEVDDVKEFCSSFASKLCFWDSAVFHVAENNAKGEVVGPVTSPAFRKMCPHFSVAYRLLNGTDLFAIQSNGYLAAIRTLDHENSNPGPLVTLAMDCSVHMPGNHLSRPHQHVFQVNVVDQNDNGPQLQEEREVYELRVDHAHFRKEDELKQNGIMFVDKDSHSANGALRYLIQDDPRGILRPKCTPYEVEGTFYNCKLYFAQNSGTLPSNPYCVTVKLIDDTVLGSSNTSASVKACITSEDIPRAEALRDVHLLFEDNSEEDTSKKKRSRKNSFPAGGEKIVFPHTVTLYRTATNLSRVVQPVNLSALANTSKLAYGFELSTPIEGLNITKKGGIVYVKNVEKLRGVLLASYELNITWSGKYSATVKVVLKEGNPTCVFPESESEYSTCATFYTQRACQKYCSVGSGTGGCQWRPPVTNNRNLHKNYGTCSPDLVTCPDNVCDPLESMGHSQGIHVCPQDCTSFVFTGRRNEFSNRGIFSATGVCYCEENAKCTCLAEDAWKQAEEAENQTFTQTPVVALSSKQQLKERNWMSEPYWTLIFCIFGFVATVVIVMFFIGCYRQKTTYKRKLKEQEMIHDKLKSENRVVNIEIPLSAAANDKLKFDLDAKWEMKRENIELHDTIGEGEFGKVVRGYASHLPENNNEKPMTVAVKMLKTGAHHFELVALMSEYQMLQDLSHPNVIRLLGACSTAETPLLIIEYCHFGSLKNYLRLSRNVIPTLKLPGDEEKSETVYQNEVEAVTEKDVLSFAWQVSKGMSYLADMKLVHRDLAARNVLVAEGKVCKISDFGLTRDIYEDDAYLKKSKDRVPVKWMAPESLSDQVYTSKSDVWSFGVLCWEIITLGASPYPAVPLQNLLSLLMSGYRMSRPNNCSEEVYGIIQSCWIDEPQKRPSFDKLMKKWEDLMLSKTKYLDVTSLDENGSQAETVVLQDEDRPLWTPPMFVTAEMKGIDNKKYFVEGSSDTAWQMGYDLPKPVTPLNDSEKVSMRYENVQKRFSQPEIVISSYDHPMSHKRVQSYLEMDKVDPLAQNNLNNEIQMQDKLKDVRQISFTFVNQ